MARPRWAVLVAAIALAAGACSALSPTPQVIYVTPAPTPPTIYVYVTPAPTPPPPTLRLTPAATEAASICTGSATSRAFLAQAASTVAFDLYCAAAPQGWSVAVTGLNVGGMAVHLRYTTDGGGQIDIQEGPGCIGNAQQCSSHQAVLGTASFGGMTGALDLLDSTPTYGLYVNPGTDHAYEMIGKNVTQSDFAAFGAAMTKLPRSGGGSHIQASGCSGADAFQAFFAQAAVREPFDVYCGVVPKDWSVSAVAFERDGLILDLIYENGTGGMLEIGEGDFCGPSADECSQRAATLGTVAFGDVHGELVKLDANSGYTYAIFVDPGTPWAHEIDGKGVSQADFVSLAAGLLRVARP